MKNNYHPNRKITHSFNPLKDLTELGVNKSKSKQGIFHKKKYWHIESHTEEIQVTNKMQNKRNNPQALSEIKSKRLRNNQNRRMSNYWEKRKKP